MILTQFLNNGSLIRYYSDSNFQIRQIETDTLYDEAVDTFPSHYTYEETDILLDGEEDSELEEP